MSIVYEFGWVFIYISLFGISDYILTIININEKKYIYYILVFIIGIILIYNNKNHKDDLHD